MIEQQKTNEHTSLCFLPNKLTALLAMIARRTLCLLMVELAQVTPHLVRQSDDGFDVSMEPPDLRSTKNENMSRPEMS